MSEVKLLDSCPLNFGKEIGQIGVIVIEFFAQVIGKVYFDLFVIVMDKLNDEGFYFLNKYFFIIIHQFKTGHLESSAKIFYLIIGNLVCYFNFTQFNCS